MYQRYRAEMSAAANKLRVVLFLGSTREGRLGLRVAKFMRGQLEKRNYEVDVFDYVDVARLLNVKRTTAYNIVKRAEQNHGQIERPRGGHRHAKVTDAMRAVVRAVVEEHPDFTIRNINRELRTRLPQSPAISQTTISGILDGLLVTTKQLEDAPAERNSDRTKQQRHAYATWLMHEVPET
ncbi:NAD(P)H:quinone oxidoreductase-like protein [Plakobranchus ocellatus]|uniref:NAD(P)H:quinone oxidoreductase-like protein n=1 Tax=Plakobranchus ocellatus TaxID=259542 RepID=A0AAV3Z514_9GAST|nr:NAD(P)H:quinone oxidoreductase-like protein [Plakobranchus ocellatus]